MVQWMQRPRHVSVTQPSHERELPVDPLSTFRSNASEARTRGVTLSSVLLAVPALIVAEAGPGAVLAAASLVVALALLELRPRAPRRSMEMVRLAPAPVRTRPPPAHPRARWELVERDGRRTLVMRWR